MYHQERYVYAELIFSVSFPFPGKFGTSHGNIIDIRWRRIFSQGRSWLLLVFKQYTMYTDYIIIYHYPWGTKIDNWDHMWALLQTEVNVNHICCFIWGYYYSPMWFIQVTIEFRAWINNYIPYFHADLITYPWPRCNAGLSKRYVENYEWNRSNVCIHIEKWKE